MKLFTVHGASDRSRVRPIEPAEVCMVADTPPSVEVGPAGGGVTGLAGVCWVVWYWQSTEAGSGCGRASVAGGPFGAGGGGGVGGGGRRGRGGGGGGGRRWRWRWWRWGRNGTAAANRAAIHRGTLS